MLYNLYRGDDDMKEEIYKLVLDMSKDIKELKGSVTKLGNDIEGLKESVGEIDRDVKGVVDSFKHVGIVIKRETCNVSE